MEADLRGPADPSADPGVDPEPSAEGYRGLSLWWDGLPGPLALRAPLAGSTEADVAIVGGGLTGLWTAYYLTEADPGLRIVVLERDTVGFGASGRNGGWCSALFAAGHDALERAGGPGAAAAMHRAMQDTVREVGRVTEAEGIPCGFALGGTVDVARTPAQWERARAEVAGARRRGVGEEDLILLDADAAAARIGCTRVLGATYTPHCAAIDPARLVRGLAAVLEARGVTIHERTTATEIAAGAVVTSRGTVRAPRIVRATEGYTVTLRGEARTLVPVYSLMIATEPLDDAFWSEAGLAQRETFADHRHVIIYGQRTEDGRLAFGGRGAPYHYGSAIRPSFERVPAVHDALRSTLVDLFPALADVAVTHRWGGALGISRDWFPSVGFDAGTGLGWAGGYVGDGLSTTNLAGRTLAELITARATARTGLAWVGHRWRRWEPEPLRSLGINAGLRLAGVADRAEDRAGRPTWQGALLARLTGG